MKFGIITVWNYAALLVLLMYFVNTDCKRKKSSFTFEALMSGMNSKEKEMFKEELNKEVKRFRATQQKHHKTKGLVLRKGAKKRKLKEKLPKFLPGICDPICAHECLHGCDFRCCIPDYQQNHKIPRPPPMVVLPGSCSSTCSPTCRPLCTDKCCAGGVGGMFQSSQDLVTLNSQTCPAGCSKSCLPRCVISCCVAHVPEFKIKGPMQEVPVDPAQEQRKQIATHPGYNYPVQQNPLQSEHNIAPDVEHMIAAQPEQSITAQPGQTIEAQPGQRTSSQPGQSISGPPGQVISTQPEQHIPTQNEQIMTDKTLSAQTKQTPLILRRPITPLVMPHTLKTPELYLYSANTKCTRLCPDYCAPLCLQGCCISAKRDYTKLQPSVKLQNDPFATFHRPPLKTPLGLQYIAANMKPNIALSRHDCPSECFTACNPNCEVRCCNLQPNILNQLNHASMHPALHMPDVQSDNFMKAAAYRLRQTNLMNKATLKVNPALVSRLLPHVLTQGAKQVTEPVQEHIESMDPNSVNFASNVETIHALSKDMISKPERSKPKMPVHKDPITDVSTPKGSIPKVSSHEVSTPKVAVAKDSISKDTNSKNSVHKDSIHKDSIHRDSIHRDSIHRDSIHRDSIHRDSIHRDSIHRDSIHRDSIHRDSIHRDSIHRDSIHRDSIHRDSISKDSNSKGSVRNGIQLNTTPTVLSKPPPSEMIIKKSVLPSTLDISWNSDAHNAVQPIVKKAEVLPVAVNVAGATTQVEKNVIPLANLHSGKKSIVKPQMSSLESGIPAPNPATRSSKPSIQVKTSDVKKSILEDKTLISDLASADIKRSVTPTNPVVNKATLVTPVIKESPLNTEELKKLSSPPEAFKKSALTAVNKSASPIGEIKMSNIQNTKKSSEVKNLDIKKSVILATPLVKVNSNNLDKKSATTCPHQCASECAPNCSKSCCNRQIVYESFHKNQKKSKIAFQLELLK